MTSPTTATRLDRQARDAPIIASVSGGKDSAALCLHLKELGLEYRAVHMDTGWEHPDTDRYIHEVLDPAIGPIEWIVPGLDFVGLVRKKQFFPTAKKRFCAVYLKVVPLFQWIEREYGTQDVVNVIGIRADESQARALLEESESVSYGEIWRPLLRWSVEDVIAIHARHGVPPNPLYLRGFSRVGCWPCIHARKSEIRALATMDPARVDFIRALEAELSAPKEIPRTFFGGRTKKRGWKPFPIDQVVAWSRTKRGGKQYEAFFDEDRSGCMRWGLCDV